MIQLGSPELVKLSKFLEKYSRKHTIPQLARLLTAPSLHANTLRIETLVHLAVVYCNGSRRPGVTEIGNWLNRQLGATQIPQLEDPVEDVFITNIETPNGNRRIFEGIWESNDYFLQVIIETLGTSGAPQECKELLDSAYALLRLSDCVADRVGLKRWSDDSSMPKGVVRLIPGLKINDRAHSVVFTNDDLECLGIQREALAPFIFNAGNIQVLTGETIGHTSLERRPLVGLNGNLVLALPHAVSPAIRRFVLTELKQAGHLDSFGEVLSIFQSHEVEEEGLRELKSESKSIHPPSTDGKTPSLHSWLLKYDINKYLHVVMLHDQLDWLERDGLSSFLEYPEELRLGLENYLIKVSEHCRLLPDFIEGMTLIVLGGLGRGFMLEFENWPNKWTASFMRISDLLMLSGELDHPVTRYLKCMKQKEEVESKGVHIMNVNGL